MLLVRHVGDCKSINEYLYSSHSHMHFILHKLLNNDRLGEGIFSLVNNFSFRFKMQWKLFQFYDSFIHNSRVCPRPWGYWPASSCYRIPKVTALGHQIIIKIVIKRDAKFSIDYYVSRNLRSANALINRWYFSGWSKALRLSKLIDVLSTNSNNSWYRPTKTDSHVLLVYPLYLKINKIHTWINKVKVPSSAFTI